MAVAAVAIAAIGLLIVVMPLAGELARKFFLPGLVEAIQAFSYWRHALSATILVGALAASHKWLPGGRRSFGEILPGISLTLACWLVAAQFFAVYLRGFADYVSTYAGLAGIVVALVFLYLMSAIFLFGAEFNGALLRLPDASPADGQNDSN